MTDTTDMTEMEVHHQGDRYVAVIDGEEAGFTVYVPYDGHRVFVHTEVHPAFSGKGIATELIHQALLSVRADGDRFAAVCPFVVRYVQTHHEFDDILTQRIGARRPLGTTMPNEQTSLS